MSLAFIIVFLMQVNGVDAMVFPVASPQFKDMGTCLAKMQPFKEQHPEINMGCIGVVQGKDV